MMRLIEVISVIAVAYGASLWVKKRNDKEALRDKKTTLSNLAVYGQTEEVRRAASDELLMMGFKEGVI